MWMNEPEIDETVEAIARHAPQFSKYAKFLSDWRHEVNAKTDGWHSWRGGSRPAETLMSLLESVKDKIRGRGNFRTDEAAFPTDAQFKKALSAIRAAATKHNLKAPTLEDGTPKAKTKGDLTPPLDSEVFITAAQRHGEESEPDHEAGDLQIFFRAAYGLLTPDQRHALLTLDEVRDALEIGLALDPLPADLAAAEDVLREAMQPAPGPKP